uniref:Uncharacterized protein n=1 Tax=Arundo donax TaxID=35708 RepID=A0A0A9FJ47_ARUDO
MGMLILQKRLLKNCQPWNLRVTYGGSPYQIPMPWLGDGRTLQRSGLK